MPIASIDAYDFPYFVHVFELPHNVKAEPSSLSVFLLNYYSHHSPLVLFHCAHSLVLLPASCSMIVAAPVDYYFQRFRVGDQTCSSFDGFVLLKYSRSFSSTRQKLILDDYSEYYS